MRGFERVGNQVYQFPRFIHEYGDKSHHMSMMRTVEIDDLDEGYIRGTGPSDGRFRVHEFLDGWFFYPIRDWMSKWIGDNEVYHVLRAVLGFFWGFNCGFPARDVALYTVWYYRGCKPLKVWDEVDILDKESQGGKVKC